jgi:hypothetical protein
MNFIYKPSGKAEAEKGFQDDLIFATGLALMGIDQSFLVEEEIQMNRKPTNVRELIEWEATHGLNGRLRTAQQPMRCHQAFGIRHQVWLTFTQTLTKVINVFDSDIEGCLDPLQLKLFQEHELRPLYQIQ